MPYLGGYHEGYVRIAETPEETPTHVRDFVRLRVWLALEDPGQVPTWWELTHNRIRPGWSRQTGRPDELDDFQTGTFEGTFDNRNAWLAATNEDGPWFGLLRTNRRLKVEADLGFKTPAFTMKRSVVGGTDVIRGIDFTTPIFLGYVDAFPQHWDISDNDATVSMHADDEFALMEAAKTGAVLVGTTGDAIVQLLVLYRFPGVFGTEAPIHNDHVDIDKGTVTIASGTVASGSFLEMFRKLALTEQGDFFIDPRGRPTFHDAEHVGESISVWGDDSSLGELPYSDVTDAMANANIFNIITVRGVDDVQTDAVEEVFRTSPSSVEIYGPRERTFELYPGADLNARADALIERYAVPRNRIAGWQPQAKGVMSRHQQILRQGLGSELRIIRRPHAGTAIDRESTLQGINLSGPSAAELVATWQASQAPIEFPNVMTETESSFEDTPLGWTGFNAVLSQADPLILTFMRPSKHSGPILTNVGFAAVLGLYAMRMDPTVDPATIELSRLIPVVPNHQWRFGVSMASALGPWNRTHAEFVWETSTGSILETVVGEEVQPVAQTWTRIMLEDTAPTNSAFLRIRLGFTSKLSYSDPGLQPLHHALFFDGAYLKRLS